MVIKMAKAIGMVEMTTVSTGYLAADEMAKAADVDTIMIVMDVEITVDVENTNMNILLWI